MARLGVRLTHPQKVLFPDAGITKAGFADYMAAVAPVMLTHLRGRPLMLQRFPHGITESGFVQKDFDGALPDWMERVEVAKEGGTLEHPLADSRRALVWLANQDCVTIHTWLSRRDHLRCPDRLVIDLDPGAYFEPVREAARSLGRLLRELGLVPFLQTTGSRGLHVVSPLRADTDFETVREFARDLAALAVAEDPDQRTIEVRKQARGDRVYLDVMRNAYAQTAVAPYSVRAKPRAPVATPLSWDELDDPALRADGFTVGDLPRRLEGRGDPWKGIGRHARALAGPRRRLDRMRESHA